MATPFTINPNPLTLYPTPALGAVLAKVRFVVRERQGLKVIFGGIGLGKTSVVRLLCDDFNQWSNVVARLLPNSSFNTDFSFLKAVCAEFGIKAKRSLLEQEQALREYLIQAHITGKTTVLLIDEAQQLTGPVLEQIRAMLNFETNDAKLIQVVLAAQPELRDRLRHESKKAIRSRIYVASNLDPLTFEDAVAMIQFRCEFVRQSNPFTEEPLRLAYKTCGGVPRDMLRICGIAHELHGIKFEQIVSVETMRQAITEYEISEGAK